MLPIEISKVVTRARIFTPEHSEEGLRSNFSVIKFRPYGGAMAECGGVFPTCHHNKAVVKHIFRGNPWRPFYL